MTDNILKNRTTKMIKAILKVARGDYSIQIEPSDKNDELDALATGLNMMIDDIKTHTITIEYASQEILKLTNIIAKVAMGAFTVAYETSGKNNVFDALGIGINMMIDDMRMSKEQTAKQIKDLHTLNKSLQESLAKVETLNGLLPICAWCKKIRDDEGYWQTVETYVEEHSKAEFTHGLCPQCQKNIFP